jgi:hypothetical protein
MPSQPQLSATSSRRNTSTVYEDGDLEDVNKIVQVCTANLAVLNEFLATCKDTVNKKQNCLLASQLIQQGLQTIQTLNAAQPTPLEEIQKIVEQAVAKTLPDKQIVPSYSMIAAKNVAPSATPKITPQVTKYKMLVTPAPNCPGIKTAEDTRRVLTAKLPSDFGIRADKVVIMKNNVLVESRCALVLKLGESKLLKELKLSAKPVEKSWPRM